MELATCEHLPIKPVTGVYCILNSETGKFYIGSARDIKKRISEHMHRLRHGTHENKALQADFCQYGDSAFTTFSLRYCDTVDNAINAEQFYIDNLYATKTRV